ncbi:Dysferlin [Sarracenia purpurea var. burkii]
MPINRACSLEVADQNNDPQMADFIESDFLPEQVEAIKKIASFVTQLRMVGKGHELCSSVAIVFVSYDI